MNMVNFDKQLLHSIVLHMYFFYFSLKNLNRSVELKEIKYIPIDKILTRRS